MDVRLNGGRSCIQMVCYITLCICTQKIWYEISPNIVFGWIKFIFMHASQPFANSCICFSTSTVTVGVVVGGGDGKEINWIKALLHRSSKPSKQGAAAYLHPSGRSPDEWLQTYLFIADRSSLSLRLREHGKSFRFGVSAETVISHNPNGGGTETDSIQYWGSLAN